MAGAVVAITVATGGAAAAFLGPSASLLATATVMAGAGAIEGLATTFILDISDGDVDAGVGEYVGGAIIGAATMGVGATAKSAVGGFSLAAAAQRNAMRAAREFEELAPQRFAGRSVCLANSFLGTTPVVMADGEWVPISLVSVGDWVWAQDPVTGEAAPRQVLDVITGSGWKDLVDLAFDDSVLSATTGHPMWVIGQGWVDAGDVQAGNQLLSIDGSAVTVERVSHYEQETTVYNLNVEGLHTFYAAADEAVLVHNCGGRTTVLGNSRDMENLPAGVNRFNPGIQQGQRIPNQEMWIKNRAFLDDAMRRCDDIRLATSPLDARDRSWFATELSYMQSQGWTAVEVASGNWRMVGAC